MQSYNRLKVLLHTHTYTVFTSQDGATTGIYTKAKEKATLKGKGGRQVRGPNVRGTWMNGQVHETEGVLPAPSWRDGGQAAMSA